MNPREYQIQINNPCTEDWNAMSPNSKGRFCDSCAKTVVDFTGKSDNEIKSFFQEHKGTPVCGHFQKHQVDRIRIELDERILQLSIPFWQKFLAVLLVTFGQDIFGADFCFAQTDTIPQVVPAVQVDSVKTYVWNDSIKVANDSLAPRFIFANVDTNLVITELSGWCIMTEVRVAETSVPLMGSITTVVNTEDVDTALNILSDFTVPLDLKGINDTNPSHPTAPKNNSEPERIIMVLEEKKRRKRKKKSN